MKSRPQSSLLAANAGAPYVKYMNANSVGSYVARRKPLPPDANNAATQGLELYQLKEPVDFRCSRCKKDNIRSDSVAADIASSRILCTRCFAKLIRPRTYVPTRVVPYASLLAWLQTEPPKVNTQFSAVPGERPVEAAIPSGERMAAPMITGGGLASIGVATTPAVPVMPSALGSTNLASAAPAATSTRPQETEADLHPCKSTFGQCLYGPLCYFVNAPKSLCLPFLMGLCTDDKCSRTHHAGLDLPPAEKAPARFLMDGSVNPNFDVWIANRKRSPNKAEWQLWHNSPQSIETLINQHFPPPPPPAVLVTNEEKGSSVAPMLSALSFKSALKALKKP